MKNLLTKLFFITLVLSAQNLFAAWGGTGTVGDPYTISSATDLALLATNVNLGTTYLGVYFKQTLPITLTGSWTAIGTDASNSFQGTYDGNGYKITGMSISAGGNQGLFGWVNGATIKNIGVEGVNINATGGFVGGLVGLAAYNCHIINCYSTGSVSGASNVGGLAGSSYDNNEISNCYSRAAVTSADPSSTGGLIGYLYKSSYSSNISNCYSTGSVVTNGGGFIGIYSGSTITSCFWDNQTSGQIHGLAGSNDVAGVTGESTTLMTATSIFLSAGWSGAVWNIGDGLNNNYPYLKWQNPGGTPLPVELTSFTSSVNKNGVTLKWSTATEVNNYGFDVERRAVNSTSSTVNSWAKIGFVAGNGTSSSPKMYIYTDASVVSGTFAYRLKQIDNNGSFTYSQSVEQEVNVMPAVIGLSQNYPNPFNPSTQISFAVASTEQATLVVYNMLGQPIVTLFDGVAIGQQAYRLSFDASKFASGVYFYKLETPTRTDVRRMQLLK